MISSTSLLPLLKLSYLIIYYLIIIKVYNNDVNLIRSGWGTDNEYATKEYSYTTQYLTKLRTDYKMRLINDFDYTSIITPSRLNLLPRTWVIYYQIDILIDPCRNRTISGGYEYDECCLNSNEAACQDNPNDVIAGIEGDDMHIAYFQNSKIPTCSNTIYDRDPNCGTYIEIHRSEGRKGGTSPTSGTTSSSSSSASSYDTNTLSLAQKRNVLLDEIKQVIADVALNNDNVLYSGYSTTYIDTSRLCAGRYELWWVIRTPSSGP